MRSKGVHLCAEEVAGWRLISMARDAIGLIGVAATSAKGGGGCSQWWGAASSKGGRSPGGQVGRLGQIEVAGPSWPGSGEDGWAAWAGPQAKAAEVGATRHPKRRGGGSGLAGRGRRPGTCWAGSRCLGLVGPNWGMKRKIYFGLFGC
jgi:hypothetical protein